MADNFISQPLTLYGHTHSIYRVVTASHDIAARVYLLQIEELIALAKSRVTRSLTTEEC